MTKILTKNNCKICEGRLVSKSEIKEQICALCAREDFDEMSKLKKENENLKSDLKTLEKIVITLKQQKLRRVHVDAAERDGAIARDRNLSINENPFPLDTHKLEFEMWEYGWKRVDEAEKMKNLESLFRNFINVVDICYELLTGDAEKSEIASKLNTIRLTLDSLDEN
jgi:hypothetical protein